MMDKAQLVALDKLMPPVMRGRKVHQFILDPVLGKFMEPENREAGYEEGILIGGIPLNVFRAAWLKSTQGEAFLLNYEYNHFRFPELQKFMQKKEVVWAPVIKLCGDRGAMEFEDGRHRFLWLSIHGYKTFSACVAKHEEVQIRRLLGMPPR